MRFSVAYVAAVVDESGKVAALGGVDDGVMVDTEHVAAADALFFVALLPHVSNHLLGKGGRGRWVMLKQSGLTQTQTIKCWIKSQANTDNN